MDWYNSQLFLYWVENVLSPTLITGQVVIMDNCSIHKSAKVQELIQAAGCRLIYLPPYSPDLNPIENYWAVMKNQIKKIKEEFDNILDAIDAVLIHNKRGSFEFRVGNKGTSNVSTPSVCHPQKLDE